MWDEGKKCPLLERTGGNRDQVFDKEDMERELCDGVRDVKLLYIPMSSSRVGIWLSLEWWSYFLLLSIGGITLPHYFNHCIIIVKNNVLCPDSKC